MNLTYAIDIAATCEPADTTYLQTSSILTNYRPVCECCVYQAIEVSIHIYTYTVCFSHLIATATPSLTTPPRRVDGSGSGRGAGYVHSRTVSSPPAAVALETARSFSPTFSVLALRSTLS